MKIIGTQSSFKPFIHFTVTYFNQTLRIFGLQENYPLQDPFGFPIFFLKVRINEASMQLHKHATMSVL